MIRVHGVPLSPFVRKVLLTLDLKGVPYEIDPVFPGAGDADFLKISPLGKIPVLEHDGFTVADTSVICRYLDRVFPEPSIYPDTPADEARACWLEELGDSRLIEACAPIFIQRMLNPKMMGRPCDEAIVQDAIEEKLPPLLTYLESVTPEAGPLVGEHITIADIGVVTCFIQAAYGDYQVDGARYPKLRAWIDRMLAEDVVAARLASERAMLPG
ncbi:MAG TPA: glutathione S-transferase family protein [Pseudomonadales bacterium]|nr:glutathione S-transferase family protein [Pseudomonadales bacterium]